MDRGTNPRAGIAGRILSAESLLQRPHPQLTEDDLANAQLAAPGDGLIVAAEVTQQPVDVDCVAGWRLICATHNLAGPARRATVEE